MRVTLSVPTMGDALQRTQRFVGRRLAGWGRPDSVCAPTQHRDRVPASEHAFEIRYGPDQASPDWPYDDDPRLALQVRGPAGEPVSISGLIDSGAITTALPLEMAEELGYRDRDLFYMRVTVPGGSVGVWKARLPCRAVVPELENLPFELCPYFVPQLNEALWGRADFFVAFDVVFEHGEGRVLLTPRVAEHPLASMAVTAR